MKIQILAAMLAFSVIIAPTSAVQAKSRVCKPFFIKSEVLAFDGAYAKRQAKNKWRLAVIQKYGPAWANLSLSSYGGTFCTIWRGVHGRFRCGVSAIPCAYRKRL